MNQSDRPRICLALALLSMTAAPTHADGPGAYRPPDRSANTPTISERSAIDAYNLGYAAIQRADRAGELAETATTEDRNRARREASNEYKQSLKYFSEAVRQDASMHEAYTYLGYANRKLGRYPAALDAYDRALRIDPHYPHAIEYQGEAFLGLDRIEQARINYLRLYALNKGQARKLLQAMQVWVAKHADVATKSVEVKDFVEWVAQRAELTGNDPDSGW